MEIVMAICASCGNDYDRCIEVTSARGETRTYDCFQCAIADMAPICESCGCRIIGHGRETAKGEMYCCDHCAAKENAQIE
jgi:hypothetical protein